MTYVFHTRCGCIPCGLSILLSPPRRAGRKGVGCSHRQCYRLFNACSTGPTHQTCLTACRRVGDLRSIHRVPNLTDNGVLMVHRAWSDRFRCTAANQPNFRLRKKQICWDWKKDNSFYKPRLKSISVGVIDDFTHTIPSFSYIMYLSPAFIFCIFNADVYFFFPVSSTRKYL